MAIKSWKPYHDLDELFRDFHATHAWDLATDVSEDEGNIYVSIHIPGIKKDKIDISVEGNRLQVTGERQEEHEEGTRRYIKKEIREGKFERIIPLPCAVDESKTTAEIGDGVIHIALPKKTKTAGGQKISIKSK